MSQLTKLKKWLTLKEAATYLAAELHEPIEDFDLIKLAFDRHLKLSILIHSVTAEKGSLDGIHSEPKDFHLDDSLFWYTNQRIETLSGCFDLPLFGYERLELLFQYNYRTDKKDIAHETHFPDIFVPTEQNPSGDKQIRGTFIADVEGQLYRLISKNLPLYDVVTDELICMREREVTNYFPFEKRFVIRIEALNELITLIKTSEQNSTENKALSTKTKNSYLSLIRALSAALIKGLTDIPNTDAEAVLAAFATAKIEAPVSKKTLAAYLKEAMEEAKE